MASQANEIKVPSWRKTALSHRQRQVSQIPPEWRLDPSSIPSPHKERLAIKILESHLSPFELEITSLSTTLPTLQQAIASKTYTATQITSAFCHRAALLQQTTSCLTEILFASALSTAVHQDEHLARTGQLIGPFHGTPISIKDNQDIRGVDTTLGWVGLINHPASANAEHIQSLINAGAILYCKTNVPQSLMMSDSYNHLYGQTVNPLNRNLISGGSSGGEGALIGGGGSVLGYGTDIGGSIRIPAALQGLYGLSPSTGRMGNRESCRRQKYIVPPVGGPLARDIDSIEVFMAAYLGTNPWTSDPGLVPLPWRADACSIPAKKLKVAYVTDDGVVRPQPPVARAVRETVRRFERAGHECLCFDDVAQKYHARAYDLWLRSVLADGGERFKALSELTATDGGDAEPLIKGMLVGKPEDKLTVEQRMGLHDEIYDFQRTYMKVWEESGVDVLVMPVTQWVGLRPKMWVQADMYVGNTSIWNLMDWTALAVPSIRVDREVDKVTEEWRGWEKRSFSDGFNHDRYEELLGEGELDGMPVGVQLVTGRLEEEKAVGIARLLSTLE